MIHANKSMTLLRFTYDDQTHGDCGFFASPTRSKSQLDAAHGT